jgi:hypothetical protein
VDGCDVCRVLPADICRDIQRLVVWWRQQIGVSGAVTGDSGLELVLVVAKALAIARGGSRVRNTAAVLVSCFRSGAWRQERDCLADAVRWVSRLVETGDVAWATSDDERDLISWKTGAVG